MLAERRARPPSAFQVFLESNNVPREHRGQGRFVSGPGSDDQYRVGALDRGRLQQSGGDHRLHHVAAAAERQILVDIGNLAEVLGDEKLAPDEREGVEDSLVRNLVGSDLTLDHMSASGIERGHRIIRRMMSGVYIDRREPAQPNDPGCPGSFEHSPPAFAYLETGPARRTLCSLECGLGTRDGAHCPGRPPWIAAEGQLFPKVHSRPVEGDGTTLDEWHRGRIEA